MSKEKASNSSTFFIRGDTKARAIDYDVAPLVKLWYLCELKQPVGHCLASIELSSSVTWQILG